MSNKCLYSDHCPQGGSEPGLNGVDNLYIPTSSLAICFSVLEDSGPSAETCFDTERHTETCFDTSFVSDLELAKSATVAKRRRQTFTV